MKEYFYLGHTVTWSVALKIDWTIDSWLESYLNKHKKNYIKIHSSAYCVLSIVLQKLPMTIPALKQHEYPRPASAMQPANSTERGRVIT